MGQVVRWLRQTTPEITKTTNTARGRYKFQWTRKSDLTLPNLRRRLVKISYGSTTQVDTTGLSSCLTEQLTNGHPLLHPGMCCEWDLSVMGPQLGKDSVLTTSKSVNITYIQFANLLSFLCCKNHENCFWEVLFIQSLNWGYLKFGCVKRFKPICPSFLSPSVLSSQSSIKHIGNTTYHEPLRQNL